MIIYGVALQSGHDYSLIYLRHYLISLSDAII